jgi:hypothetical protein
VGNGLADRPDVADWRGVADRRAEGLTLALGVMTLAVPLGRLVGVAEPVPGGENGVGVAEGEDPVQAETDAGASMVKVAQPTMVNLALSPLPMMVVCIFMRPPHAFGRWRTPFTVLVSEEKSRASHGAPGALRPKQVQEAPTAIKVKPIDGTDMQWPVHH